MVAGPVQLALDPPPRAGPQGLDDLTLAADEGALVGEHRPAAQLDQAAPLVVQPPGERAATTPPGGGDGGTLGGGIRHDRLGGVGGRGGAVVGDEVEQRGVDVVADGADHGRAGARHRPHQGLVAERQEVLDPAAAAGDDDDVDLGMGVELGERGGHLGHGGGALHGDLADLEAGGRPAAPGVLDDVPLRGAGPATDQPHPSGQEGQRPLAVAVEQALLRQVPLEVLEPGEQLADADRPDLPGVEHQRAPLGPEGRLGLQHDPRALGERARHRVEGVDRDRDRQAHVDVGVAQGEVGGAGAGTPVELHDLALDPQRRHLLDVLADLHGQQAHRPRLLGGRLGRPLGQRAAPLSCRRTHAPNSRAHHRHQARPTRAGRWRASAGPATAGRAEHRPVQGPGSGAGGRGATAAAAAPAGRRPRG